MLRDSYQHTKQIIKQKIQCMRDFRLLPRCKWGHRSSGIVRQRWLLVIYRRFRTSFRSKPFPTQLLSQPLPDLFLEFLTLVDGTNRLSRNVEKYHSTLRNIPDGARISKSEYFNGNDNNQLSSVTPLLDISNRTNQWQALLKGTIKLQHASNPFQ